MALAVACFSLHRKEDPMPSYLTIHAADRCTEVCAVQTRHSAAREINEQLLRAGRPDLCLNVNYYGDSVVDDEFRDQIARRLGENPDAGEESILPLAFVHDATGWDIHCHLVWPSQDTLRWMARIALGRTSGYVAVHSWSDGQILLEAIDDTGNGDDRQVKIYVRMTQADWQGWIRNQIGQTNQNNL
jgi:hypothetical protein